MKSIMTAVTVVLLANFYIDSHLKASNVINDSTINAAKIGQQVLIPERFQDRLHGAKIANPSASQSQMIRMLAENTLPKEQALIVKQLNNILKNKSISTKDILDIFSIFLSEIPDTGKQLQNIINSLNTFKGDRMLGALRTFIEIRKMAEFADYMTLNALRQSNPREQKDLLSILRKNLDEVNSDSVSPIDKVNSDSVSAIIEGPLIIANLVTKSIQQLCTLRKT
jgi:hypothetical protein